MWPEACGREGSEGGGTHLPLLSFRPNRQVRDTAVPFPSAHECRNHNHV
jgi:hypothetical protein